MPLPDRRTRPRVTRLEDRIAPAGDGLSAVYFDNAAAGGQRDFTGANAANVTPTVNFNWGTGGPAAGIGADTFTARFAGRVEAPVSGDYTFPVTGDDGYRLWVDDRLIVDRWVNQSATAASGTIALEQGRKYHVVLEYYENGGDASVRLEWAYPGQARQVVPQQYLYSDNVQYPSGGGVLNIRTGFTRASDGKFFQAAGNGTTDDTAALQAAFDEVGRSGRPVYLPSGTYRVTAPLRAANNFFDSQYRRIQGQSRDNTVIRLDDADNDFQGNATVLLDFLPKDNGASQFRNQVDDLTVNVGRDNPGVIGLDYIANNQGGINNITIRAEPSADGLRRGAAGLRQTQNPGPSYNRNI